MWSRLLILTLDRNHAVTSQTGLFEETWDIDTQVEPIFDQVIILTASLSNFCSHPSELRVETLNPRSKYFTPLSNWNNLAAFGGSSVLPDVYIRSKSESKIWKWASVLSRWTEIVPRCSVTMQRVYGQLSGLGFLSAWLLVESESGK